MIKYPFELIKYSRVRRYRSERSINKIIGLDSETYTDGSPFLFALSDGFTFGPKDSPRIFFRDKYISMNYGVWNLKFDSGSLIYNLPVKQRKELRVLNKTKYKGHKYFYIPHKMLRISGKRNAVTIWDINTFFHMSLDNAAYEYLGEHKLVMKTKTFTKSYVKKNIKRIKKYCVRDAVLVEKLFNYLLKGFHEIGVRPTNLYSPASVSYTYFNNKTSIPDINRLWENHKGLIHTACDSYNGGKFEIYRRGKFSGISYDINSAYPYEMAKLKDISHALVRKGKRYQPDADYGFLECIIDNSVIAHVSCAVKRGGVNIYPAGRYKTTITKTEYEYLKSVGVKIKIIKAYYLYCTSTFHPYKKEIDKLYKLKTHYKKTDLRKFMVTKLMLNGFYGKHLQLVLMPDGYVKAGPAFNPIYASYITANTRIRLSKLCQEYNRKIYAVHTDSIILNGTLPKSYLGSGLGQWAQDNEGDGVLIACGIYQHGAKNRFRGLEISNKLNWTGFLKRQGDKEIISIPQTIVKSWTQANFQGRDKETNIFTDDKKDINLNCDIKRVWMQNCNAKILLNEYQESIPYVLVD